MKRAVKRLAAELTLLVRGAGDAMESTIDFTRRLTVDALAGKAGQAGLAQRVTAEAMESAVEAGNRLGADLGSMVQGAVIGVIRGLGQVTTVTPAMIGEAVRAAIRSASRVGADLERVSWSAVEGAVEAGKEVGINENAAASAAAQAAVKSVRRINRNLAEEVAETVSEMFTEFRAVLRPSHRRPLIAVIAIDRETAAFHAMQLSQSQYRTLQMTDLEHIDHALELHRHITLALIDLTGFGPEVWERCHRLRQARIPFVLLSPHRSPTHQRDAVQAGASGVFTKPLTAGELDEHIRAVIGEPE